MAEVRPSLVIASPLRQSRSALRSRPLRFGGGDAGGTPVAFAT